MPDPTKRAALLDQLREILDPRVAGESPGEGLPPVPRAPIMLPEPYTSNPELGRTLDELLRVQPMLKHRLKSVIQGPSANAVRALNQSGMEAEDYGYSSLGGIVDKIGGSEVSVRPRMTGGALKQSLTHELAHIAGRKHGSGPEKAEDIIYDLEKGGSGDIELPVSDEDLIAILQEKLAKAGIKSQIRME